MFRQSQVCALLMTGALGTLVFGQTGQTGQAGHAASINGVVQDAVHGQPLVSATVALVTAGRTVAAVVTNAQGEFTFESVMTPCRCQLRVTRSGYFESYYGRSHEGSTAVRLTLDSGQQLALPPLALVPHSSLAGLVLDVRGRPVVRVPVRLVRVVEVGGTPLFVGGPAVTTNDLGEYQFSGLRAADYVVHQLSAAPAATAVSGTLLAGAVQEQYYPGAASPALATPVSLSAGEERVGIDFHAASGLTFMVKGRVQGGSSDLSKLIVRLIRDGGEVGIGSGLTVNVDASGVFVFEPVPPGHYSVVVTPAVSGLEDRAALMSAPALPRPLGTARGGFASLSARTVAPDVSIREWRVADADPLHGHTFVSVEDRDVDGVVVAVATLPTVSGTIEWDHGGPILPDTLGALQLETVVPDPALGIPRVSASASGARLATFSVAGVRPGTYVVRQAGASVKSVSVDDRGDIQSIEVGDHDITGIHVVLASQPTLVSGTVTGTGSHADAAQVVLAFPADEAEWNRQGWSAPGVALASVSDTGAFRVVGLPAGTYRLVAVPGDQAERWRDRAFLRQVTSISTLVTVNWGESRSVQVPASVR